MIRFVVLLLGYFAICAATAVVIAAIGTWWGALIFFPLGVVACVAEFEGLGDWADQ